ncbi:hypothetical protein RJT34_12288 [Clitoria ternatea]|uniref:Uncharacterized protein n=1 Tax=Clitoria ternatea TaxID=43366 RepID=A0AAN9JNJ4_CLITE
MRNPKPPKSGSNSPCCSKVGLKRGPWTPEEDQLLANYIKKEGEGRWRTLPKRAGLLRCGKSCRLRWMNYLRPSVKRGHIAPDEEDLILRLHRLLGNRWSLIAGRIPGRTDNEIKNYWNTHLSKKLISQGIDPRTHKPLNPPISLPSSSTSPIIIPTSKPIIMPNHHQTFSTIRHNHDLTFLNQEICHLGQHQQSQAAGNVVTHNDGDDDDDDDDVYYDEDIVNLNPSAMGLVSNEECDNDMNVTYGCDDVFSSFLNSLINEDAFTANNHDMQSEGHSGSNIPPLLPCDQHVHDPLISITNASAPNGYDDDFGVQLEPPLAPSNSSQNDSKVHDHNV